MYQAEFMYKAKPKVPNQWKVADDESIPFVAILAPAELADGNVRIKAQVGKENAGAEGDALGEQVKMEDVVSWFKERL
jgi:histidyl-tRNA synthetase